MTKQHAFEKNFQSDLAYISIDHLQLNAQMHPKTEAVVDVNAPENEDWNINYFEMDITDSDYTTFDIETNPYDVSANDPHWDTLTDLFMGAPTLQVAEY